MRVYAAGPASNFLFALVCLLLFVFVFMAPVEPKQSGAAVTGVVKATPAARGGLQVWELVTHIEGENKQLPITRAQDLLNVDFTPNASLTVRGIYRNEAVAHANVTAGLAIIYVDPKAPAGAAGLEPGMVLETVESSKVKRAFVVNQESLGNLLSAAHDPGDLINLTVLRWDETSGAYAPKAIPGIRLADRGSFYKAHHPSQYDPSFDGVAFLGITTSYLGILATNPENLLAPMRTPYAGVETGGDLVLASLRLITFPLVGLSPAEPPLTDLFQVSGPLGALPPGAFWMLANSLYWIFWLNIMVGLTNVLPLKIVDGGHFFRDALSHAIGFRVKDRARAELHAGRVEWMFTFLILFLIVWQFVGPRVA